MTHDFKEALRRFVNFHSYDDAAIVAALRMAAAKQEAGEAVERGEAVKIVLAVTNNETKTSLYWPERFAGADFPVLAVKLTAIAPIPRPIEIEADVESADAD